jgi:hydroxymethylpyrimidine pyrophosphatase-like HAD family hydrolase
VKLFPDRSQAILLLGLRTSGSYFVPLLRAFFGAEGYGKVSLLTIVPGKGPGRWEAKELERYADEGYTALIVDDPPHTGGTIFTAFEIAGRAGFGRDKLRALVPAHPTKRDWFKPLSDDLVVSLAPEEWHKRALLEPEQAQARLGEYFKRQDFVRTTIVASTQVEQLNAKLIAASCDERGARLKRIFEVHLETFQGRKEIRYVLAKSVGWGWLGYHAFLAGRRLAGFVPPILGLRDGILYMEWIPQVASQLRIDGQKEGWIEKSASYVAARARCLNLDVGTAAQLNLGRQDNGAKLLGKALSRVYGGFFVDLLAAPRLKRMLGRLPCPFPTLIDGNMRPSEWIVKSGMLLKTDYEHHGLGKEELNVIDPAYDVADAILNLDLSPEEERRLIERYIDQSGDVSVDQRLFMSKMLAGLWAMKQAHGQLFSMARIAGQQQTFHQRFLQAWHFLTVQAARHCGGYRRTVSEPHWRSPFVMTDIDGVLDRRLFGFPCTTAAGIEALSILDAHKIPVALNSARSVAEVKEYCQAYSLAGAVAEHGSYMWDAVNRRGRILISREAESQLDELRNHLQRIPGVFLDHRHEHSIRAFTYLPKPSGVISTLLRSLRSSAVGDGVLTPLPSLLVQQLMTDHRLDLLSFHQTTIDTTVVAKEVNKGSGLLALRDWVLGPDAETIAIGDQLPDLAMFSVATHSFAPANVGCAAQARLLGCQITRHSYQRGFLEMANALTHADGHRCKLCADENTKPVPETDLFMEALQIADRKWTTNLMSALFDRSKYRLAKLH